MTPQEINRRIAEACGWTEIAITADDCGTEGYAGVPPNSENIRYIPDYHGDLNAMHEAEIFLKGNNPASDISSFYRSNLCDLVGEWREAVHATAAQRAEAFLRTIGKWEDGE